MLRDGYHRKIDYLRISVTDRCNLSCIYCMPLDGIEQKSPGEILTFEEIARVVKLAIRCGINKIKITGGEPLMRRDLPRLFTLFSSVVGLEDISLTTNGVLLKKYAAALKVAGLKRINISIDTLNHKKFAQISRTNALEDVLEGIDAALTQQFLVKLNVVILRGINDDEILDFVQFAQEKKVTLRFIELMPMMHNGNTDQTFFVSADEIKENLKLLGALKSVNANLGNGPAEYYRIEGGSLIVGFIAPLSHKFCFSCNRLRLTADGLLMPCLGSNIGLDIKNPLRQDKVSEVLALFKKATYLKPEGHQLNFGPAGQTLMSQIGG